MSLLKEVKKQEDMMKNILKGMMVAGLLYGAQTAGAATLAIPNTFTTGTPAVASQVNANFTATATAVNDIEARLAALEAVTKTNVTANPAVAAAGTWAVTTTNFGVEVTGQNTVNIGREVDLGTVVLDGAGGWTGSFTSGLRVNAGLQNNYVCIDINNNTVTCPGVGTAIYQGVSFTDSPTTATPMAGTYTVGANGLVTITVPGVLAPATGGGPARDLIFKGHLSLNGQVIIASGYDTITHETDVFQMVRIQ